MNEDIVEKILNMSKEERDRRNRKIDSRLLFKRSRPKNAESFTFMVKGKTLEDIDFVEKDRMDLVTNLKHQAIKRGFKRKWGFS